MITTINEFRKSLNENIEDETIFNDQRCELTLDELNNILLKHGVPRELINHYSTDLFRIPSKYVSNQLIEELVNVGVTRS